MAGEGAPLSGVRVVEHAADLPARYAGFLLSELGAEVTRLAPPGAAGHPVLDRRKRSAPGDLHDPAERQVLAAADAVLADRPLDAERGASQVWCEVSGWGPRGPRAGDAFDEALVTALSGIQTFQWSWAATPVWLVTPMVSYLTGMLAALGVVSALVAARRGGGAQRLSVSALDAAFTLNCGRFVVAPGFQGSLSELGDPHGPGPTYGIYETRDGWLFVGALTTAFWVNLATCLDRMDLLADPRLPESPMGGGTPESRRIIRTALEAAFRTRTTAEWIESLERADVPCGVVCSRADCLRDPAARAGGHAIAVEHPRLGTTWQPGRPADVVERSAAAPPSAPPKALAGCLSGMRVVDFTSFIAGPFCPRLLGDLGAEVVKVEAPGGDPFRMVQYGFVGWNRGKRSLVLDVKDAAGLRDMRALVASSDVLVDNVRPGVMERLGLGDDVLFGLQPGLVRLSITGYGRSGPDAPRPGFDPVFQARCGHMRAQGGAGEPVVHTIAYNDYCAGALGALAAVAALHARLAGGRGQRVDVSLFRTALVDQAADMLLGPDVEPPSPGGRDFLGPSATQRLYACADGWICVSAAHGPAREALAALTGSPLARAEDPDGVAAGALAAFFAPLARHDALAQLGARGIPAAPCLRFPELLDDPQVRANGCMVEVHDAQLGPVVMAGPCIRFERTPIAYATGAPQLGADGAAVLASLGGARS